MALRNALCLLTGLSLLAILTHPVRSDDVETSPIPLVIMGKSIKVNVFTTLVRPLKPQDYSREVDIYLPAAYVADVAGQKRFPVIYLLHGSPGKPEDFEKNGHWPDFLEQNLTNNGLGPAILVAPDGNFNGAQFGDSEWINSPDKNNRFEDLIVDQIVPYVDAHFRTIATAKARIIAGVSEGGFGAVNIALHRPNVFSYVLACSGYYANDGSGWARQIMGRDKGFLAYNSPLTYIDDPSALAKNLQLWQAQHYYIGSGLTEQPYSTESAEIAAKLHEHKIPVYLYQPEGKHGWGLWNALFITGLKDLFPPTIPSATSSPPSPNNSTP